MPLKVTMSPWAVPRTAPLSVVTVVERALGGGVAPGDDPGEVPPAAPFFMQLGFAATSKSRIADSRVQGIVRLMVPLSSIYESQARATRPEPSASLQYPRDGRPERPERLD